MRKAIYAIALFVMSAMQLTSCAQGKTNEPKENDMKAKKALVVFYSRAGQNYSVGNVKVGNTQKLAEMLAAEIGADTFQIRPVKEYPADYTACTDVAKAEKQSNARPAIVADKDIDGYDVIFLGYPNWWSDAPMPVYTFIEKHSWEGKTVIPFCTHEGSGLSNLDEMRAALKGATVPEGFDMYGHEAQAGGEKALGKVRAWLKSLGYDK